MCLAWKFDLPEITIRRHAMTPAILAGITTFAVALSAFALWRSLPPRGVCPRCRGGTEGVAFPGPVRFLERALRRRWCPACGWTGIGRAGPARPPRGAHLGHGSGFLWGEANMPPDMGFTFAPKPSEAGEEGEREVPPPDHPSGFRWGGAADATPPPPSPDHPSGFRWGQRRDAPRRP